MSFKSVSTRLASGLVLVLLLGACGGDDGEDPTATALVEPTATTEAPATATVVAGQGSTATDGICQVIIPESWFDDGTGRGATAQGDRWTVFGNAIAGDQAWTSARDLLKSQFSDESGADISESDSTITVVLPNGRGYVVRQRFDDRYCDFSVMARQDRPEEVTAVWLGVASTLGPLSAP
jgi:hypothetical protein